MKVAYRAFDTAGRLVTDTIEAASQSEAAESLRRRGLYVESLSGAGEIEQKQKLRQRDGKHVSSGKRLKFLQVFTKQMQLLINAGTQIVEALHALERQTDDPEWKRIIIDVRERVEEGESLRDAIEHHPDYFDGITRGLIEAGETSGRLPSMLDRLSMLTQKQLHLRSTIRGAMIYPAVLVGVCFTVLIMMIVFVLPRFSELFKSLDITLPPSTAMLMALSQSLMNFWWAYLLVLAGVVYGFIRYMRSDLGKDHWDTFIIKAPLIGPIARSFITARIIRLLGVLLDGSLPLLSSIELTQQAAGNKHYRKMLENTESLVEKGESMSGGFADQTLVPKNIYEAMRNGEQAGKVSEMLLSLSDFMDEENDILMKSITSIIEPVILIMMGLLVGFIAMSIFLPLFDLTSMAGG